jgi:hypothetical protein
MDGSHAHGPALSIAVGGGWYPERAAGFGERLGGVDRKPEGPPRQECVVAGADEAGQAETPPLALAGLLEHETVIFRNVAVGAVDRFDGQTSARLVELWRAALL